MMEDHATPKSTPSTPAGASRKTTKPNATPTPGGTAASGPLDSDDEGDEEMVDLNAIKAFAKQVQQAPSTPSAKAPTRVVIPKRGEKDFEPLNETQTIQEKMLRESRQALFDGLSGVRGTSSKNMSHAIWCTGISPYPQVKIIKGQAFSTMGHTIRPSPAEIQRQIEIKMDAKSKGKETDVVPLKSRVELLPEEALYLLERGTMQIWKGQARAEGNVDFEFDEEEARFEGLTELTVSEGFARFVGMDGLSLERYQVYAGLRRLGYTVQRTPQFLPWRFRKQPSPTTSSTPTTPTAKEESISLLRRFRAAFRRLVMGCIRLPSALGGVLGRATRRTVAAVSGRREGKGLLDGHGASNYGALYEKLRIIPSGHSHPVTSASTRPTSTIEPKAPPKVTEETDLFAPLVDNPYLPFYHVWKPNTHWTMARWDKASEEGLEANPPAFWIGVVDARSVPFPTLPQMTEVFGIVPEVPTPYLRKRPLPPGAPTPEPIPAPSATPSWIPVWLGKMFGRQQGKKQDTPQVNTFLSLKQGDRTIIVAVVDGGNVGWTRLGRGGFEDHLMVPHGW